MSANEIPFFEQFRDPAHILIWPIRDAAGERTGRWECLGAVTGILGGDAQTGATPERVIEVVRTNLLGYDETTWSSVLTPAPEAL